MTKNFNQKLALLCACSLFPAAAFAQSNPPVNSDKVNAAIEIQLAQLGGNGSQVASPTNSAPVPPVPTGSSAKDTGNLHYETFVKVYKLSEEKKYAEAEKEL